MLYRYRLKDRAMEQKLNELSDGDFSVQLNSWAFHIASTRKDFELPRKLTFDFGERMNDFDECPYRRYQINLRRDEIEVYEWPTNLKI